MDKLCILITAYNRALPLQGLLDSLSRIDNDNEEITLIISIDNNGTPEVNAVANHFVWPFGEKKVIIHKEKKGLVKHFIWTGDQTEFYDNIIFLEDDLLVSPQIIKYTKQMLADYQDDDRIAAASLYNPVFNEATGTRFYQIQDGSDIYFLQQPYWGHVWIKNKWSKFHDYLKTYKENNSILPPNIAKWTKSFKKIYVQYLIENDLTVVTPRISLVTNSGTSGLHSGDLYHYQSELQIAPKSYSFRSLSESKSIYDAFEELKPEIIKELNPSLKDYDFTVDLNGLRNNIGTKYILTTKDVKNSIKTFSSLMKPTELGVVMGIAGDEKVKLALTSDVIITKKYYRKRRYNDYKKNYYLGVVPTLYLLGDWIKQVFKRLVGRK